MLKEFEFYKTPEEKWYINLPEWEGDPEDLEMVEGANKWLDLLSGNSTKVTVSLGDKPFENAETLTLLHVREPNLGGGGNYYLECYQENKVEMKLWLCEVTRFVFKDLPQKIYFKKCD